MVSEAIAHAMNLRNLGRSRGVIELTNPLPTDLTRKAPLVLTVLVPRAYQQVTYMTALATSQPIERVSLTGKVTALIRLVTR